MSKAFEELRSKGTQLVQIAANFLSAAEERGCPGDVIEKYRTDRAFANQVADVAIGRARIVPCEPAEIARTKLVPLSERLHAVEQLHPAKDREALKHLVSTETNTQVRRAATKKIALHPAGDLMTLAVETNDTGIASLLIDALATCPEQRRWLKAVARDAVNYGTSVCAVEKLAHMDLEEELCQVAESSRQPGIVRLCVSYVKNAGLRDRLLERPGIRRYLQQDVE